MANLSGIGMWLWLIDSCEGGDVEKIASKAQEYELSWVAPKAGQGTAWYYRNQEKIKPLAKALHAKGIRVFPWGWVFGRTQTAPYNSIARLEGEMAFRIIHELEADGWIVDAEADWKRTQLNMHLEAPKYMEPLSDLSVPILVSTYRYPKVHREFPYKAWQNTFKPHRGDGWVPQVYWEFDSREYAGDYQLQESFNQYNSLGYLSQNEAYHPAPSVYGRGTWKATSTQVLYFSERVRTLELSSYIPWSWQHMQAAHWDGLRTTWYRPDSSSLPPISEPEPLPEGAIKKVRVTSSALNVRWGPNGNNPKATAPLSQGKEVYIYEVMGYWGKVEKDKCHWIHLGYTKEV